MKLQQEEPTKVLQRGLEITDKWSQGEAVELLNEVSTQSGVELSEASQDEAAAVLLRLWKLFRECEGIWFTLQLDLSKEASGVKM
jgi:hypothetical protein